VTFGDAGSLVLAGAGIVLQLARRTDSPATAGAATPAADSGAE
jgi:hypothetical protein